MDEKQLRQVVAHNLERFMGRETQATVARRAGIAQSHVSRLLRCEASATTDLLAALARALGIEPWELLMSEDATREAIYQRVIMGRASGAPATKMAPAHSRRKKRKGSRHEAH